MIPDSHVEEDELQRMRQDLVAAAEQLHSRLDHHAALDLSWCGDSADVAENVAELEHVGAVVETEQAALRRTEQAIARIDQGTYGRCEVCGGQIPAERLQAVPTVTSCVGCA